MPLPEDSLRVAIAGAASLRGQDLKLWLEESGFPASEVRLFDEEPLAGTLTGVAGEQQAIITRAVRDSGVPQGYWFWGAADNLRLATANAVQIAEKILVS